MSDSEKRARPSEEEGELRSAKRTRTPAEIWKYDPSESLKQRATKYVRASNALPFHESRIGKKEAENGSVEKVMNKRSKARKKLEDDEDLSKYAEKFRRIEDAKRKLLNAEGEEGKKAKEAHQCVKDIYAANRALERFETRSSAAATSQEKRKLYLDYVKAFERDPDFDTCAAKEMVRGLMILSNAQDNVRSKNLDKAVSSRTERAAGFVRARRPHLLHEDDFVEEEDLGSDDSDSC